MAFGRGSDDLPESWRLAFEVAVRGDCPVVRDAVLGINARVNYGLALALREAGLGGDRRR